VTTTRFEAAAAGIWSFLRCWSRSAKGIPQSPHPLEVAGPSQGGNARGLGKRWFQGRSTIGLGGYERELPLRRSTGCRCVSTAGVSGLHFRHLRMASAIA
jgi:hypothetical protein